MKTKRLALWAATGVTVVVSSMAFAAGSVGTGSSTSGTDATMGAAAGSNINADVGGKAGGKSGVNVGTSTDPSAGTSVGTHAAGTSASTMSNGGATSTSGLTAGSHDKSSVQADERASTQTGVGGVEPGQNEAQGSSTSKRPRHHHVGKSPKTAPEGTKSTTEGS